VISLITMGILGMVLNIQPVRAEPDIIYVPDDYAKIQWAVGNATSGDTIIVRNGTYSEQVEVDKSLNITSFEGPEGTIVNATGKEYGFGIGGADNVTINGFTIVNATGYGNAAIYIYSSKTNNGTNYNQISNNILKDSRYGILIETDTGGGWTGYTRNNTIENNVIESNWIGIAIENSGNNTITYNNISFNDYVGIYLLTYSTNDNITYNNLFNNTDYEFFNDQSNNVTAENNWWGTTNTTIIDSKIWDFYDDNSRGTVDYDPFLDDPFPNRPPTIDFFTPDDTTPEVNEGQNLEFTHTSSDPDDDPLSYSWLLDDFEQAITQNWTYSPGYEDAGPHNVTLVVSDGELTDSQEWIVTVIDVNRPPTIDFFTPDDTTPEVNEGQNLEFTHTSSDPDDDPLSYSWLLDDFEQAITQNWTYSPGYEDAGPHNVTLVVSDGELTDSQEWAVTVNDVPPVQLSVGGKPLKWTFKKPPLPSWIMPITILIPIIVAIAIVKYRKENSINPQGRNPMKKKHRHKKKTSGLKRSLIAILISFLVFAAFVSCYQFLLHQQEQPEEIIRFNYKAIIVDQLNVTAPNPNFRKEATGILTRADFEVEYYSGDRVDVNLFAWLGLNEYGLIILRVHSGIVPGSEHLALFTNEPYSNETHKNEEEDRQVGSVSVTEGSPNLFGVGPNYIKYSMLGRLSDSVVIVMGCDGLYYKEMADAFIKIGAKAYIAWDKGVLSTHTDRATLRLLYYLVTKKQTIKNAVSLTNQEVGPDPQDGSVLLYHPNRAKSYSIPERQLTMNIASTWGLKERKEHDPG